MNENKLLTVKEFAAAAGVSSQRIYQRLDTNLKPFVSVVDGHKMLSAEGLQLFEIQPLEQDLNKPLQTLELLQAENETLKAENAELNSKIKPLEQALEKEREQSAKMTAENAALNEKIQALAKTLQTLEQDKAKLNERLDKAEDNISNLTIALKAAQALHGMEKKTKVIEIAEPERPAANVESRTVSAPRPAQRPRSEREPQQSPSFLDFIKAKFRRK